MITKKISELFHIFNGMTSVSKKWQSEGNCQFIDYLNVFNNLSVDTSKLNYATVKSHKQNTLLKGDILFTSASETIDECGLSSVIEQDIKDGIFLDDHLFGIRIKAEYRDFLNPSYLKYYFRCGWFRKEIKKSVKGITRFYIKKSLFENLQIPIPPIDVQNKIVKILDKFTNYKAELTAELTLRKEQYKYYRDMLLNNLNGLECKKISDIFNIKNGYTPSKVKIEYWTNGTIPWFRMDDLRENGFVLSKSKQLITTQAVKGKLFEANSIILATTATIGVHALITSDFLCNQQFTNFSLKEEYKEKFNIKFLYYYFFIIDEWCVNNTVFSAFPSVQMNKLRALQIPIPSIEIQNKIVETLDKFSSLINDISDGLPKEIELRNKQYEYYRDLLLDFKEKND
ncbi:MAG: restriction endonuclease subunit S [Mycoplasma sp.]|nr:restriction endonuclease subunit S [Mycoplasma sp.]